MRMPNPTEVSTRAQRAVLPPSFKDMLYSKVQAGERKTIVKVAFSVFIARDKESREPLKSKKGNDIHNVCAYVGFDDGYYTTVKNEIAVSQLVHVAGDYDANAIGVTEFNLTEPCHVLITTVKQKYRNNKEYEVTAFAPAD